MAELDKLPNSLIELLVSAVDSLEFLIDSKLYATYNDVLLPNIYAFHMKHY